MHVACGRPIFQEEDLSLDREQHGEWLCSVANDSWRIAATGLVNKAIDKTIGTASSSSSSSSLGVDSELAGLMDRCYGVFSMCTAKSLDYYASLLFTEISASSNAKDGVSFLDQARFASAWVGYASAHAMSTAAAVSSTSEPGPNDSDQASSENIFLLFLSDLRCILEDRIDYLEAQCHFDFICICIDRVVTRYLSLIQEIKEAGTISFKQKAMVFISSPLHSYPVTVSGFRILLCCMRK
jgi:hypothetical protein